MTDITLAQLKALDQAIGRLDSEEHRYVERFGACPNGCEYAMGEEARTYAAEHPGSVVTREAGIDSVQTAGPADCDQCFYGSYEDEDAPWLDEDLLDPLRALLTTLTAQ